MKQKIITKNKIDWLCINPIAYLIIFLLSFVHGIVLVITSFIPMLNYYAFEKMCKDDKEKQQTKNPLIKEVKYRIIKQKKIVQEVLEKIE